jgi:exopolysaccharide biosynthesis polyprenyl glycosylphosphotransferase
MRSSLFGVHNPLHKACVFFSDILSIAISFSIANQLRFSSPPDFWSIEYICLNLVIISSLFICNSYTSDSLVGGPRLPLNTFFIILASAIPSTILIYLFGPERFTQLFGRGIFPVAILILGITTVVTRVVINYLFKINNSSRLVVALGAESDKFRLRPAFSKGLINYEVIQQESVEQTLDKESVYAIIIMPEFRPSSVEQQHLVDARLSGIAIFSLTEFFENILFLVPVNEIDNDWLIRAEGFSMLHSSVTTRLKRVTDIIGALVLLTLTVPILLLTAFLTKILSKGPVFFSQTRVGMHGKKFTIYKFRTMRVDAEESGAQWAKDNDDRITPLGHFFRKTRIDELPQCWNIIKGDMSIIGPRPERPEFTSSLAEDIPYYDLRHVVKPGLTGWAQVSYPYGASTEDSLRKLQYDLYYIKNYSLLLDLNILLRTVLITFGRGGR